MSKQKYETQDTKSIIVLEGTSNWVEFKVQFTDFCDDIPQKRTALIELRAPNFDKELDTNLQSLLTSSSSLEPQIKSSSKVSRKKKLKSEHGIEYQAELETLRDKAVELRLKSLVDSVEESRQKYDPMVQLLNMVKSRQKVRPYGATFNKYSERQWQRQQLWREYGYCKLAMLLMK